MLKRNTLKLLSNELLPPHLQIHGHRGKEEPPHCGNPASNSEKNKKYLQKERYYGSFSRSFYFGDTLQEEDVKAKLNQGVLTLHIFKKE